MAGRGKGGKIVETLKRLKELEKEKEEQRRRQEEQGEHSRQPQQSQQAEDTADSGSDSELAHLSGASQSDPSNPQSQSSDTDSSDSDSRPGSPDSRAPRGKLGRYFVKSTPPDTPRSQSPETSGSEASSAQAESAEQSSAASETSESSKASEVASSNASSDASSIASSKASSKDSSPVSTPGPASPVPSTSSDTSSKDGSQPVGAAVLSPIENKVLGQDGEKLRVAVNYMKIQVKSVKTIHLYAVFFEPNIDSIALRRRILDSPEVTNKIGSVINFTGFNLFLPHQLDEDPCIIISTNPSTSTPVEVKIQHVKIPPADELANFYNNLFNKVMRAMQLVELNMHHYNPSGKVDIPAHKLEVWPGYVCAIQEYDGGLMLNVDTSHRVLRKTTARDMLHAIYQADPNNFTAKANKLLVGSIVLTRYNNRPYRIDDIDFKRTPLSKFTMKEGQEITFIDYFKQQWGVDIKDVRQPLLLHRPKMRKNQTEEPPLICLIPELSYLTGLTDDIRADNRAMKDLATHTKIAPDIKYRRLVEFISQANTQPAAKKILEDWGLQIDPKPFETSARRFPPEKLTFGNGVEHNVGDKADWGMKARDVVLLASKPIKRWYFFYNARDRPKAEEFLKMLQQIAKRLGFSFDNPRRQELKDDHANTYRSNLMQVDKSAELIVIMTPGSSQREDRYAAIKHACCVELGIPSQVLRFSTLTPNKMRAVVANIAMQICCKQGGQLWSVNLPLPTAMYIGLDSYHDPSNKARSVVGVVSSLNKNATQWYSRCYYQTRREEIVNTLGLAVTAALKKYCEVNQAQVPTKIFIYRDGVGDGDLPMVRDYEIPQIEESIETFTKSREGCKKPQVTFVVVQKRVNVKLMQISQRGIANPPPGTVIDHTVTRRQFYDFYLISQHVHQGTVTPTHYISLLDQCNLGPDKLQKLTYKMTHLYYNFPSTIRVPAPCQYAHKLAYLMGQYVQSKPAECLYDKLYYL